MGCGKSKTSTPQVATTPHEKKTLLPASETTTDHQKEGTVTKENGEEPGNNPQQAVASVKENVQEPEEIGVLHSQLATSLDNTLASGELANSIASSASPTR